MIEEKKDKRREKSIVLELKELKKEVGQEIRKDIQEGKIELGKSQKKTNLSSLNNSKPLNELRVL